MCCADIRTRKETGNYREDGKDRRILQASIRSHQTEEESEDMKRRLVSQMLVDNDCIHCIYTDEIDLRKLGRLEITRASYVEADENGDWWADMKLSGGPKLGPFKSRKEALQREMKWLHSHIL